MAVITLSRELGSEGDKIADALCQQLGYRRIDKEMLSEVAARAGVDVDAVLAMERSFARRARLVSTEMTSLYSKSRQLSTSASRWTTRPMRRSCARPWRMRDRRERRHHRRGGQMVLRNWPRALHVHLARHRIPRPAADRTLRHYRG